MGYKGKVTPMPLTGGLISSTVKHDTTPMGRLVRSDGFRLANLPAIQALPGWDVYTNAFPGAIANCLAGADWWVTPSGAHRVIAFFNDGSLRKDTFGTGTFATTLASGISVQTNAQVQFVAGGKEAAANNRKLFMFYGPLTTPRVLSGDGATVSTIAAPPADWAAAGDKPMCGAIHNNRLWAGGNASDPHRVYYSLTTNHEDFTTAGAGSISVFPGEGTNIISLISFKGLLIVFKYPRGIYVVDTTDAAVANWKVRRLSNSIGGASPNCAVVIDDNIVFMDGQGNVYSFIATQAFGDVQIDSISKATGMFDGLNDYMNKAGIYQVNAVYNAQTREVFFTLPANTSNTEEAAILDLNSDTLRFSILTLSTAYINSLWLGNDINGQEKVYAGLAPRSGGTPEGVYTVNTDLLTGATSITTSATLETALNDLTEVDPSLADKRKSGQFLEVVYSNSMDNTVDLEVSIAWDDYNYTVVKTITIPAGPPEVVNRTRMRITGGGFAISVRLVTASGVTIHSMSLGFVVNDERII